jgi:hypothetical protein
VVEKVRNLLKKLLLLPKMSADSIVQPTLKYIHLHVHAVMNFWGARIYNLLHNNWFCCTKKIS